MAENERPEFPGDFGRRGVGGGSDTTPTQDRPAPDKGAVVKRRRRRRRRRRRQQQQVKPYPKLVKLPKKAPVVPTVTERVLSVAASSMERRGISLAALKKALFSKGYDVGHNNSRVNRTVRLLVQSGSLVRTSGTGASGSFRFNRTVVPRRKQKVGAARRKVGSRREKKEGTARMKVASRREKKAGAARRKAASKREKKVGASRRKAASKREKKAEASRRKVAFKREKKAEVSRRKVAFKREKKAEASRRKVASKRVKKAGETRKKVASKRLKKAGVTGKKVASKRMKKAGATRSKVASKRVKKARASGRRSLKHQTKPRRTDARPFKRHPSGCQGPVPPPAQQKQTPDDAGLLSAPVDQKQEVDLQTNKRPAGRPRKTRTQGLVEVDNSLVIDW